MDIGMIAGMIMGLLGAGVGIYAILYGAGFFQYQGGKRLSASAVGRQELIDRILALNDPSKPFHIVKGVDTDLIAEWRIVDAKWWGILNKSSLKAAYRALLLVDEPRHTVRCYEELGALTWTVGLHGSVTHVTFEKSFFGGRILYKKEYALGYGVKRLEPLEVGRVYDYKFDVDEIRLPIVQTVEESGWEWVPVSARRNATFRRTKSILDTLR